jgi:ABC-type bacteriocin/lantibiotic exporter with double-glycine peptidase domain
VIGQGRRYARLFSGSHRLVAAALAGSVVQSALLVCIPLLIKHLFDTDLPQRDADAVVLTGLVVLVLYLTTAGLTLWIRYTVLRATKRSITQLRSALVARIYTLPQSFHDRQDAGALHATIVSDSERVDVVANAVVGQILPAAVVAVALSCVALALDPLLFVVLAVALPAMIVVKRRLSVRLRARTRAWQRAFDQFSSQTQLALRTRTLAETRAAEEAETASRSAQVRALSDAGLEMAWRQYALGISQGAIAAISGALVLVIGGRAVAQGSLSIGALVSFYAIVVLLQAQVTTITMLLPTAVSGRESLNRLDAILEADEQPPYQGARRLEFAGEIELRNVSFGYPGVPVLHDVDLRIAAGEHLAILGPNGAGKSTLASLILGIYRPWSGTLAADGVPYDEIDMRELRRWFGVVLQDPVLLPSTIGENIAYGRPAASASDVERAAAIAGVAEFVEELTDGYDTPIGQEGALLSGGQRQRIAVARALLGDPRLLILDEPTTHLDEAAVIRLQTLVSAMPGRPTVITITHDDRLARSADRVVVVHQGTIQPVDSGAAPVRR